MNDFSICTCLKQHASPSAPSFQHSGVPSGGDWALERRAAFFAEGVDKLVVKGCSFYRNDGNALMLSGYSRDAILSKCAPYAWVQCA